MSWLGSMRGTAELRGDVVAAATEEDEWEVLRE
jgi:hypothetical protein